MVSLFLLLIVGAMMSDLDPDANSPVTFVLILGVLGVSMWSHYAINCKRWHDRGKSGWWSLIEFLPIIGIVAILIECEFMNSEDGENQYGPKPG